MIIEILGFIGTFVFAVSGAQRGIQNRLDLFGIITVAFITACGGGIIRDTIIGEVPTIFYSNIEIAIIALATTSAILFRHETGKRVFVYSDAMGLAVFVTYGTITSLEYNLPIVGVIILGTLSGIGGGIIRDIIVNEVPMVLSTKELYAVTAIFGIIVFLIIKNFMPLETAAIIQASIIFIFRIVSFERKWSLIL